MAAIQGHDQADAEALALEMASARAATRALRKAVARLVALALAEAAKARLNADGQLTPTQQQTARGALNAAIAGLSVDVASETTAGVARAVALALRQESGLLRSYGIDAKTIRLKLADPVLSHAGESAERVLRDAVGRLAHAAGGTLACPADLEAVASKAAGVVSALERNTRFLTNRAINDTTRQIAAAAAPSIVPPSAGEPPLSINGRAPLVQSGLVVVWVAERDACLTCLALSGHVADPGAGLGFDEFATFSPRQPPGVWPPGMPLMGPPRHPNCRCRLRIIAADNTMVPEALRREAERSVARGWSGHDSRRSRLGAADMLVRRVNRLPVTVNERGSRDVTAGRFSTRHRPRAPHLRAD